MKIISIEVKKKDCQKSFTFHETSDRLSIRKQTWMPGVQKYMHVM